jgi:hypothetical protein
MYLNVIFTFNLIFVGNQAVAIIIKQYINMISQVSKWYFIVYMH